jgi:hypothetical protein
MLIYACFFICLLYAVVMSLLWLFRPGQAGKNIVILKIAADFPPAGLEWLMYSFRGFLARFLPRAVWWVEICPEAPPEQKAILEKLSGRFAYSLCKCYNQHEYKQLAYIFVARADFCPSDWQRQLENYQSSA